jgi:hypothetical protein
MSDDGIPIEPEDRYAGSGLSPGVQDPPQRAGLIELLGASLTVELVPGDGDRQTFIRLAGKEMPLIQELRFLSDGPLGEERYIRLLTDDMDLVADLMKLGFRVDATPLRTVPALSETIDKGKIDEFLEATLKENPNVRTH